MRRMLPAAPAKLLQLQPVRRRLPVLGLGIIPLFALTALHRDNFSGHSLHLTENRELKTENWSSKIQK